MFQSLAKVACVLAVTVIGTNVQAAGDAEAGQAKAATCVACHGVDGNSAVPTFPKLSGLGHKYLLKQMQDIRDGRRPVALMAGQVDNMTDQDLSDIAAFYDAQPRTGGTADPDKVSLGRKFYLGGIAERQVPAVPAVIALPAMVMVRQVIPRWQVSMQTTLRHSSKCFERVTRTPPAEPTAVRQRLCVRQLSV